MVKNDFGPFFRNYLAIPIRFKLLRAKEWKYKTRERAAVAQWQNDEKINEKQKDPRFVSHFWQHLKKF
jgi:hypothetical protein